MKRKSIFFTFIITLFFSGNAFSELVFSIGDSYRGSKPVEMKLNIHQQDLTLEEVDIECETEKFEKYSGDVEYSVIDKELISFYIKIPYENLKIKEKKGNCKRFLDIWKGFYESKYNEIIFSSTKITKKEKDKFDVKGILSFQGYENEISFEIEAIPIKNNKKIRLNFSFVIDLLNYRTEEEDIFELWYAYREMPAEFKFNITSKSN